MSRNWKKYNEELIKRGEILMDPEGFGLELQTEQTRKTGRPPLYTDNLILLLLFKVCSQTPIQTNSLFSV